ncbi:GNAT family N-acetyltransferase [Cellulomonas edaphi]|uniref:GNAT family N-acetyltransferase n=1 Tax=Cellulomonas edaphi TaxID=3053468 RepID=A0ABT7S8Z8_9CELL|nr:GNAT family N-acetyltransferase [Cellulomons edaphi]MDM7832097.1 GNAT family N-acetyltransferase [Cellulomons edaphi]
MPLFTDHADVSVRPAVAGDEDTIARVQLAAWRDEHAQVLGADTLDLLDERAVAAQWATAITAAPPGHRVLVACDGATVVGFAAIAPVAGPDDTAAPGGVILALEVLPAAQRGGHGSRLLAAAVDLLREQGADQVHTWVLDGDDARAQFLRGAGLGPDDTSRELASGTQPDGSHRVVSEHRWWAAI